MSNAAETVLIVGIGNELLGDEGLGVHVARLLLAAQPPLPSQVEVLDAGTALLDALPEMSRHSRVILVDAVHTGQPPGTLYRAQLTAGLADQRDTFLPLSLHQCDLLGTLQVAETIGMLPQQLTLLGAEPETIEPSIELSPRLARAAEQIVAVIFNELFPQPDLATH